ncbi:MAG: drug/metabolite transporter (DMT)-like permease [Colwellia sp.]|jgi:drug/metabolite transporter (DMT)-like permease
MARRYRKRSHSSQIVSDSVFISSRLPWWGALLFGMGLFTLFYFFLPTLALSHIEDQPSRPVTFALEIIIMKRIHWSEYFGIICGTVGLYFAVRNYVIANYALRDERTIVGVISRIIGRNID